MIDVGHTRTWGQESFDMRQYLAIKMSIDPGTDEVDEGSILVNFDIVRKQFWTCTQRGMDPTSKR